MAELEEQIRAWADAVASTGADPVRAEELLAGDGSSPPRGGRRTSSSASRRNLVAAMVVATLVASGAVAWSIVRSEGGDDGQELSTDAGVPAGTADCAAIEAFADRLGAGGQADYTPSASPAELADWSDVVLSGTLLDGVTEAHTTSGLSFVAYRIAPDEVVKGSGVLGAEADEVTIFVWNTWGTTDLAGTTAPVGAPVVVFASTFDDVGGLVAQTEGFATACPDGPPIGELGFRPGWASIGSLDELVVAAGGVGRAGASAVDAAEGEVGFEVVAVTEASIDDMGTLAVATTPGELADLWADVDAGGVMPPVDLGSHVVVAITIPDDACPPTLEGFTRLGSTLEPRFSDEHPEGCEQPLVPRTFIVAIEWATAGPAFRLVLPGQPTYGFDDVEVEVRRPASDLGESGASDTTGDPHD